MKSRNGVPLFLIAIVLSTISAAADGEAQAQKRHITAYDLATITDLEAMSVSPDGRWIAFMTRRADPSANTYEQAWHVISTSGGATHRIAAGGEAIPTVYTGQWLYTHGFLRAPQPVWSPDNQWIIYHRQDRGRVQLWRSRIDGSRNEPLTHNEGDVHVALLGATEGRVAFAKDRRRLFFQVRLSLAQRDAALAKEARTGFLFDDRFLPSASPHPLGLSDRKSVALWVYDFATHGERQASEAEASEYKALLENASAPPERKSVRDSVVLSAAGSRAWAEARDPKLQGMRPPKTLVAQLAGAPEPVVCEAAVCTSQSLTLESWRNDQEILFTFATHERPGERILYAWRPAESAPPHEIWRTRGIYRSSQFPNCGMALDRLVCSHEELNRPRRLITVNLDSGAMETLYDPNPAWTRFDLGPGPQLILVRLPSGAEGRSYLVLPPDYRPGQRLPLIINAYNCEDFYDMRGAVGDEYPVYPFAAQGFAVLCHTLMPLDWEVAARDPKGGIPPQFGPNDGDAFVERIQAGLDAAVAELDRMGVIDPDRVAVTGLSLGGQTVEYALIHMSRLTAAISSGSHLTTSTPYLAYPNGREEFRAAGFGSSDSPRFNTRSISRNAHRIRAPLLMNVSDAEFETESIVSLQAADRAVEMYVYPGEFHIKNQPAHRLTIYSRNIDWLNFWLQGREDMAPAKAEQYKRWRAMRAKQCELFKGADAPWYCRQ